MSIRMSHNSVGAETQSFEDNYEKKILIFSKKRVKQISNAHSIFCSLSLNLWRIQGPGMGRKRDSATVLPLLEQPSYIVKYAHEK